TGRVRAVAPDRNRATTTSSNEVMNANSAPVATPGAMSGTVTVMNAFTGDAPSPTAARSSFGSTPCSVALTTMTTNGDASTVWATTMPQNVPIRLSWTYRKNIPTAVMMSGMIIGDSRNALTKALPGN